MRFCFFCRGRKTKEGLPSGGRKGVARSAANFLSPLTELEKFLTTSVRPIAEHNVAGLCSDAEGYRSRYSTSTGRLGSIIASGRRNGRWRPERAGDFFAELSLALGCKESDAVRWKKSPMSRKSGHGRLRQAKRKTPPPRAIPDGEVGGCAKSGGTASMPHDRNTRSAAPVRRPTSPPAAG